MTQETPGLLRLLQQGMRLDELQFGAQVTQVPCVIAGQEAQTYKGGGWFPFREGFLGHVAGSRMRLSGHDGFGKLASTTAFGRPGFHRSAQGELLVWPEASYGRGKTSSTPMFLSREIPCCEGPSEPLSAVARLSQGLPA